MADIQSPIMSQDSLQNISETDVPILTDADQHEEAGQHSDSQQ